MAPGWLEIFGPHRDIGRALEDHIDVDSPKARTWLRFRLAYVAILVVAVAFGVKFIEQAWHDRQEGRQLSSVLAQYNAEQRQITHLRREIKRDKPMSFVRQQARAWGYVSHGQQLVMIIFKHRRHHHAQTHVYRVRQPSQPVWQQWWHAFF